MSNPYSYNDNPMQTGSVNDTDLLDESLMYCKYELQNPSNPPILFEQRTSDYTAEEANLGKCWVRTDTIPTEYKTVQKTNSQFTWQTDATKINSAFCSAGAGTQSACLSVAGDTSSDYSSYTVKCEEYNGTSWSSIPDCNNSSPSWDDYSILSGANGPAGFGTSTDCTVTGDDNNIVFQYGATIYYDGTSWNSKEATSGEVLYLEYGSGCGNTGDYGLVTKGTSLYSYNGTNSFEDKWGFEDSFAGSDSSNEVSLCGDPDDALITGGRYSDNITRNYIYTWNGTTTTDEGDLATPRAGISSSGNSSSAHIFGGYTADHSSFYSICEEWTGTSITSHSNLLVAKGGTLSATNGSNFLVHGGLSSSNVLNTTEIYGLSEEYGVKEFDLELP